MYKSVSKIPKETRRVELIKQLLLSLQSFILESSLGGKGSSQPCFPTGGVILSGTQPDISRPFLVGHTFCEISKSVGAIRE